MAKKKHVSTKKKPRHPKKVLKKRLDPWLIAFAALVLVALVLVTIKYFPLSSRKSVEFPNEGLLATVNGVPIYEKEIDELYDRLPIQYKQFMTKEAMLNQTIARELLLQAAEDENTEVDDEEVYGIIDTVLAQSQMTREQLEQQLAVQNLTLDDMVEEYKKQLLITRVLNKTVYIKIEVSPQEISTFYNENKQQFEQVSASHILVNSSEEAEQLLELVRKGADFGDIAKTYSLDTNTASQGGDIPYFTRNQMIYEFANAAFALEVGEVSDPVQTSFGYHIIKITGRKYISLEEATPQIAQLVKGTKQTAAAQEYIDQLWQHADVVFY